MVALITDPNLEDRLIAQRRADGTDKYDEVWEGMYVMAPMANNEHQDLVDDLCTILTLAVKWPGLGRVNPGVNVSDRKTQWQENYRCPDVAVFLNETQAKDCGTHWFGGPDLAIEIISPFDRSTEKVPFYAKVGVRELIFIQRDPWAIVLHRLTNDRLIEVGRSTSADSRMLASQVVPLNWQLQLIDGQSAIQVFHHDGEQNWTIAVR
ncbi:MAG: Uma2 family endonuclease [Planctomycetota bacterium]|nr:Uma2 family endonuclease [Planctomycetota bacterium]